MTQAQIKEMLTYWHYYMGGLMTLEEFDLKYQEISAQSELDRLKLRNFRATIQDIVSR